MKTNAELETDYAKYRGKCREFCDEAIKADPSLTLIRGHYFCPIWNTDEPHWWCVKPDGTIHDPTRLQFASKGHGTYTPFNGMLSCAECGKEFPETPDADIEGNYAFCCYACHGRFVGVF